MAGGNGTTSRLDLARLLEGGTLACVGTLGQISREQLAEVVESLGGRFLARVPANGKKVDVLLVGTEELPLTPEGELVAGLAHPTARRVVAEEEFLTELKVITDRDASASLFTSEALASILKVPLAKVRAWSKAGLIQPAIISHGVPRFEFRQVAAARTLAELAAKGVSTVTLRRSLERLRRWLPESDRPLEQLSLIETSGSLLVRLEAGELAELDGQLHLGYEANQAEEPPPMQLRLVSAPTAGDWHEQGVEQEQHGLLGEAEASYRRALLEGGPDADLCFDLAHVLAAQGKLEQAAERYRQVVEIDPKRCDAWNNLGTVLANLERFEDACDAFRQALRLDGRDPSVIYNLADTLEEAGQPEQARTHWQAFLRISPGASLLTQHAMRCLQGRGGRRS